MPEMGQVGSAGEHGLKEAKAAVAAGDQEKASLLRVKEERGWERGDGKGGNTRE